MLFMAFLRGWLVGGLLFGIGVGGPAAPAGGQRIDRQAVSPGRGAGQHAGRPLVGLLAAFQQVHHEPHDAAEDLAAPPAGLHPQPGAGFLGHQAELPGQFRRPGLQGHVGLGLGRGVDSSGRIGTHVVPAGTEFAKRWVGHDNRLSMAGGLHPRPRAAGCPWCEPCHRKRFQPSACLSGGEFSVSVRTQG